MADSSILVTGAGSITGTALVRSLMDRGHRVIAADPSKFAVGRQLADESLNMPWASDAESVTEFYEILAPEVSLGILVTTTEIPIARKAGLPMWACSDKAVEVCEDKLEFAHVLKSAGVPHPTTSIEPIEGIGPWVVKPQQGEGSRNTFVVTKSKTVESLLEEFNSIEPMIVQPVLTGPEWETDVFAHQGELLGGVAFFKHRIKGGTTVQAETFDLNHVQDIVSETVKILKLDGPLNIGGFLTADGPVLLEVNPRFSHGYLIAEAAGGNPIEFFTRWMAGRPLSLDLLNCRSGVRFDRYWTHRVTAADPAHLP
jgi:carbamoylphosphate synthase large subunit